MITLLLDQWLERKEDPGDIADPVPDARPGTTIASPSASQGHYRLSNLDALEAQAIHIFREVAAEFEQPVLLFSGGKDSIVMLQLARKAFWPAPIPFSVLHVDTGRDFAEVLEYHETTVDGLGVRLEVAFVQDDIDAGRAAEVPGGTRNSLQTTTLLRAITEGGQDAVFGGARRDHARGVRATRPQTSLCADPDGPAPGLHRHRLDLRGPEETGQHARSGRRKCGRAGLNGAQTRRDLVPLGMRLASFVIAGSNWSCSMSQTEKTLDRGNGP
jgi:hypothetical protein